VLNDILKSDTALQFVFMLTVLFNTITALCLYMMHRALTDSLRTMRGMPGCGLTISVSVEGEDGSTATSQSSEERPTP